MRFTLAVAALVAATAALPSFPHPASKHALTTREDFVEDDFEIQAEPDEKRQVAGARSVDWPEVSAPNEIDSDSTQSPSPWTLEARFFLWWPMVLLIRSGLHGTG